MSPRPEDNVHNIRPLFMGRVCRKPGFDKGKTAGMFELTLRDFAWLCIFQFPLSTSQGIKASFENKVTGLAHQSLVSPYHSFVRQHHLSWGYPWTLLRLDPSIVPCPVLTVASWPAFRFLKRQVRWSGIPISFRIFHSLLWFTQSEALA